MHQFHTLSALRRLAPILLIAGLAACNNNNKIAKIDPPADADPVVRGKMIAQAESIAKEAQRLELQGKPDQAIERYKAAIAAYPELPVAWQNLGALQHKQGRNLQAAEAYKTASELSPTDPVALYNLGALWEDLGYLDDAARWYDESLLRDPHYGPALRRSILVDDLRSKLSQTTAERLKVAILMEREPWWINRFKRIQQRMADHPLAAAGDEHYPAIETAPPLPLPNTPAPTLLPAH